MSMNKQKRKTALEFLLDGKDKLKDNMSINYNRQYGEFLFTEKNVLKNIRDANSFIDKADKIIGSLDNFDGKELVSKSSIYAPYFTGQGNTVLNSPKKKTKQITNNGEENFGKIKTQNSNYQSMDFHHPSLGTNQKIKTEINELMQNQQKNSSKLRNDNLFIDSVQQNNIQSMQMQNVLRMKQLQQKDRYDQIQQRQFSTTGLGLSQKSQSVDVFVPYRKERDNLGYIIDPINEFVVSSQRRRKNYNLPIEQQKVSLIVLPNSDNKVLIMKRGVHFFEKGLQIKTKRDDNLILTNVFKQSLKNYKEDMDSPQVSSKQKTDYLESKQKVFSEQVNNSITLNKINGEQNQNMSSSQIDPALYQSLLQNAQNNQSIQFQDISHDQSSLLKLEKDRQNKLYAKGDLESPNLIPSGTTTFHNSQARNYSQDSVLPAIDHKKFNSKNVYQPSNYYLPTTMGTPVTAREESQQRNNTHGLVDEKSTSISATNCVSGVLNQNQTDVSKQALNSMNIDSQQFIYQTEQSICANPSCRGSIQAVGNSAIDTEDNSSLIMNQKYRKNQSMMNFQTKLHAEQKSQNNNNNSQHLSSSKTMNAFDRNDKKVNTNKKENEVVIEEKLDASASLILNNNDSIQGGQIVEINMKQNKGGEVSEFHIGKFVLVSNKNDEAQQAPSSRMEYDSELNKEREASPVKKEIFENNVHFKWRMNALDEAQLIELIRKENEQKVKLPKISIYNKKKYTSDQYPAPGDYDPQYGCIEKHNRQVYFDKANLASSFAQSSLQQQNERLYPMIPKSKSTLMPPRNTSLIKEEGYEIMFSDLMKDIKKEVRNQKVQNKELQHPMHGLLLNAIPHSNIIELNKDMGNSMSYCKSCLNNIKYYLRADNPTFQKKAMYKSRKF